MVKDLEGIIKYLGKKIKQENKIKKKKILLSPAMMFSISSHEKNDKS